jgi:hypothetical protein
MDLLLLINRIPPTHILPGQTQILLLLKGRAGMANISKGVVELKPQLLIFLRRISKITIHTPSRLAHFQVYRTELDTDFKGETMSLEASIARGVFHRTSKKYIIVRHILRQLPEDERRAGVSESEVVLAFSSPRQ